ncbi:MAG: hypothetical protein ABI778_05825 [Ignavibacteriota bacterium]
MTQHSKAIFPSLILFAFCLVSCNKVTQVINDLLSFDIEKSADIPVSQFTPTGILTPNLGIPIPLDSADLANQKTTLSLMKTLQLTKLVFTPSDPAFAMNNFDSISLAVGPDTLNTKWLASYSGSADKVILTQTDFADEARNPNDKIFVRFKLKNDPSHDITLKTDFTLTISASPLK